MSVTFISTPGTPTIDLRRLLRDLHVQSQAWRNMQYVAQRDSEFYEEEDELKTLEKLIEAKCCKARAEVLEALARDLQQDPITVVRP